MLVSIVQYLLYPTRTFWQEKSRCLQHRQRLSIVQLLFYAIGTSCQYITLKPRKVGIRLPCRFRLNKQRSQSDSDNADFPKQGSPPLSEIVNNTKGRVPLSIAGIYRTIHIVSNSHILSRKNRRLQHRQRQNCMSSIVQYNSSGFAHFSKTQSRTL